MKQKAGPHFSVDFPGSHYVVSARMYVCVCMWVCSGIPASAGPHQAGVSPRHETDEAETCSTGTKPQTLLFKGTRSDLDGISLFYEEIK